MSRHSRLRIVVAVIGVATWFVSGCSTGFVQDAAQSSLASFLIDVFSTAVTGAVTP